MFLSLLQSFGITPDKYPFLVLAILIIAGFIFIRLSIGGKLNKVKENVLIVITYLSSRATNRGRLDTTLIRNMSPMTIMEKGKQILDDSGFIEIFDKSDNREKILSYLLKRSPKTKLDVETLAIITFSTFLKEDFMSPIKTYLYEHSDTREDYMTLAGLYIRDEFLKEHPEIS